MEGAAAVQPSPNRTLRKALPQPAAEAARAAALLAAAGSTVAAALLAAPKEKETAAAEEAAAPKDSGAAAAAEEAGEPPKLNLGAAALSPLAAAEEAAAARKAGRAAGAEAAAELLASGAPKLNLTAAPAAAGLLPSASLAAASVAASAARVGGEACQRMVSAQQSTAARQAARRCRPELLRGRPTTYPHTHLLPGSSAGTPGPNHRWQLPASPALRAQSEWRGSMVFLVAWRASLSLRQVGSCHANPAQPVPAHITLHQHTVPHLLA